MDISSLCKIFLKMEKMCDLHKRHDTTDLPLWLLLRFQVWWTLIVVQKLGLQQAAARPLADGFSGKTKLVFNLLKGALGNRLRGQKRSYDMFFLGASRRELIDGRYYDICCDFLIEAMGDKDALTVIPTGGKNYFHPLAGGDAYLLDEVNLTSAVRQKVFGNDPAILEQIREILRIVADTFELEFDINREALNLYTDRVFNFQQYRELYRRQLARFQPSIVFEVCHYSAKSIALSVAAAEFDIPVVELQHGTISKQHIGYQYPNVPVSERHPALPTHIFLFGSYWKTLCNLPLPEERKVVCGFPYMDHVKTRARVRKSAGKQILVISQRLIGRQLAGFIMELAPLLPDDYRIVYKLHPAEYDDRETHFSDLAALPNVLVPDRQSPKSLYDLFAESDFQIGVFSTAVYEGLAFNLPTFIVGLPGFETLIDLIDGGYVHLVQQPQELANLLGAPRSGNIDDIASDIWAPDALGSMKLATEGLMKDA